MTLIKCFNLFDVTLNLDSIASDSKQLKEIQSRQTFLSPKCLPMFSNVFIMIWIIPEN